MVKVKKKKATGGKKKKGSKKKTSTSKSKKASSSPSDVPALTKEFYLIQIADLELRLQKAKQRCQEAVERHAALLKDAAQKELDTGAVVEYHKREQGRARDAIAEQQAAAAKEAARYSEQIQGLEADLSAAKQVHASDVAALKRDLAIRDQKLKELSDFSKQRADFQARIEDLSRQLQDQQLAHAEALEKVERKSMQFQDRIKRDMVERVESVAAAYRAESEAQLASATKVALVEKAELTLQLKTMSKTTKSLMKHSESADQLEKQHRIEMEMLEDNEVELTQQLIRCKETIARLRARCQQYEKDLKEERALAAETLERHDLELRQSQKLDHSEHKHLRAQVLEREGEIAQLRAELRDAQAQAGEHKQRLDDAVDVTGKALEAARQIQTVNFVKCSKLLGREGELGDLIRTSLHHEVEMLETLLHELQLEHQEVQRPAFVYHVGDLGFVPRPKTAPGIRKEAPLQRTLRPEPSSKQPDRASTTVAASHGGRPQSGRTLQRESRSSPGSSRALGNSVLLQSKTALAGDIAGLGGGASRTAGTGLGRTFELRASDVEGLRRPRSGRV